MKNLYKRLGSFLLCLAMVFPLLPPYSAAAEDMVYLIEDEEDFYAIMDNPRASYRLETDLDLGVLEKSLGGFSGSLDGNGHSIRYSLRDVEDMSEYSLFSFMDDRAQVTNLTLQPDIQLHMPEGSQNYTVAPLCVFCYQETAITGVTVEGSITVTGGSDVAVLTIYGLCRSGIAANCRVDMDIDVRMTPDTDIKYRGLNGDIGGAAVQSYFCELYGNVHMEGYIQEFFQLHSAQDCIASQNLELYPSYINARLDYKGSFNYLENTLTVRPYPGGECKRNWISLLDNATGSYYTGNVEIIDCSPQFTGTFHCEGVELECDIIANNSGSYMNSLSSTTDSVFRGDVQIIGGNASFSGMYNCQRCLAVGDITQEAPRSQFIIAASNSSDCVIEGDIYTHTTNAETAANGLLNCDRSTFTGNIYAVSDTSHATVAGASSDSDSCIVIGDLTAKAHSDAFSKATLAGSGSYYEGTVRADQVFGIGSNSSARADIYVNTEHGTSVTLVDGDNSYFSGNVFMNADSCNLYVFTGINNVANVNATLNASGEWDYGSLFGDILWTSAKFYTNPEDGEGSNSFSGNVTIRANSHVYVNSNAPVTIHHSRVGSWNSQNVNYTIWKHWDGNCECSHPRILNRSYVPSDCTDYHSVISVNRDIPNVSAGDASAGWDGSIDIEGRYEPERENADYGIQLTDMLDQPIPGAKLILGGASYITDDGGCVYIENGPGVISPLDVQLKNTDGKYETVLTRQACYPIPNRTNVIRLEPVVDLDVTFLSSENASEDTGTAIGPQVNIGGRSVPLLEFPLNVDIEGSLGDALSFETEYDPRENKMYVSIGSGYEGTKHSQFDEARYKKLVYDLAHGDFNSWQEANRVLQKAESIKTGIGFGSWETKFMGYVEMQFGDDWKITDSGFLVGAEGELRAVYPFSIPGVYGTLGLLGEATAKGRLMPREEDNEFSEVIYQSSADIDAESRLECAIGAGIRSARLYAEIGVGGEVNAQLRLPWEGAQESLEINGLVDAFGEVSCIAFSQRITLAQRSCQLWPQQTAANVLSRAIAQGGNFRIAPRNYAQGAVMQTMAANTQTASYLGLNSQSSYPYAEVSLLKLSNGKYLLVYTDDDLSRGSADRSTLRACIGQAVDGNLVWGEAVTVENDGTGDYGFAVTTDGYSVAILWQDSNTTFGDGDGITPEDMAKTITLSQTWLDCSGDVPVPGFIATLAEAGSMPYHLSVFFDNEGLSAAWVTSSNPDPSVYLDNETETLWLSTGGEPGQIAVENQKNISAVALLDTDLFWTAGTQENTVLQKRSGDGSVTEVDSGKIMSLQSNGKNLCYVKDNDLYYATSGGSLRQTDTGTGYDNILRLSADGRVYAAQLGTESSRVCEIQEGKALPIGEYPGYLSSWDVCDGYIVTLVRSGFEETDTAAFSAEASRQIEASRLNNLVCENPEAPTGSYVSYNADIFNDGYNAIETLPVTVTAADGTVLLNESVACSIQPGESGEVSFGFTVPEGFTAQDVTVTVGEHTQTEALGGSNLKAEARWSQAKPDGVTVKIRNTGLGASSGTVTVTDGSKTLYTGEVTVEEGQTESIWVPFEEIYEEAAQITVILAEDSGAMHSYDNEATVSVAPLKLRALRCGDLTLEPGESEQLQVTPWPMGAKMTNLGFRSEDSSIVTVDELGRVTAVSPGEGKITVTTLEGVRTEVTVTVPGEPTPTDPTEPSEPGDPTTPSEPTGPSNPGDPTTPSTPTEPDDSTKPTEPDDPAKPSEPVYENPFVDVADTEYFYTPVLWAVQKGITNGLDATHFGPGEGCTRAHVVTFLWRAAGSPAPESQANPFADVQPGAYYYDAVLWAVEQSITNGISATTFAPDATCTRGQIVTFLWRYRGSPAAAGNGSFSDVAEDQYYSTAVTWAVAEAITNGIGNSLFAPDATCTRGQIVTFLYRAMVE